MILPLQQTGRKPCCFLESDHQISGSVGQGCVETCRNHPAGRCLGETPWFHRKRSGIASRYFMKHVDVWCMYTTKATKHGKTNKNHETPIPSSAWRRFELCLLVVSVCGEPKNGAFFHRRPAGCLCHSAPKSSKFASNKMVPPSYVCC